MSVELEERAVNGGTREFISQLTWGEAARALIEERAFRDTVCEALQRSSFPAFFWETSAAIPWNRFSFVLVDAPQLASVSANPSPFTRQLSCAEDVTDFENLGGDAWLVVPAPRGPMTAYASVAPFVRMAPREQVDILFRRVGFAVETWWANGARPLWVSTSGLGVRWLHVRLDSRPKYFTHAPYRSVPKQSPSQDGG